MQLYFAIPHYNNRHNLYSNNNRITNQYKLIVFNKTFTFNDYNGVINALNFLITCGDEK